MEVNISYPLEQLHATAKYIWENNPSVGNWPSEPKSVFDVMSQMVGMMHRDAISNSKIIIKERHLKVKLDDEWVSYTGTGGYYFLYELENEDENSITIGVTILADLAVGNKNTGYVTEFIDNIEETV